SRWWAVTHREFLTSFEQNGSAWSKLAGSWPRFSRAYAINARIQAPRTPVWPRPFLPPAGASAAAERGAAAIGRSHPGARQVSWLGREAVPLRYEVFAAHPTERSQPSRSPGRPGLQGARCPPRVAPIAAPAEIGRAHV